MYLQDWSVNRRLILSNEVEIQIYVWNRKIANIFELSWFKYVESDLILQIGIYVDYILPNFNVKI